MPAWVDEIEFSSIDDEDNVIIPYADVVAVRSEYRTRKVTIDEYIEFYTKYETEHLSSGWSYCDDDTYFYTVGAEFGYDNLDMGLSTDDKIAKVIEVGVKHERDKWSNRVIYKIEGVDDGAVFFVFANMSYLQGNETDDYGNPIGVVININRYCDIVTDDDAMLDLKLKLVTLAYLEMLGECEDIPCVELKDDLKVSYDKDSKSFIVHYITSEGFYIDDEYGDIMDEN